MFAAVAVVAVGVLGPVSAAGAISNDPNPEPPPPAPAKPNLAFTVASVAPSGSQWAINYTVKNNGTATASSFHVAVLQNGSSLLKDTAHASLAAGASRSEAIYINQANCYISVRFHADSNGTVAEKSETDNFRWAVGLTNPNCAGQPRYKVKAVSFYANDESHADWAGSDEPYWTFNTVGVGGTRHSASSQIFGDVDTGETRNFAATEGCLYLSCNGGAAPYGIGFSAQIWEHDIGEVSKTLATIGEYFQKAGGLADLANCPAWVGKALDYVGQGLQFISGWGEDDLIGSNTYAYDPVYLASRLTSSGASFTDTRQYSGADSSGGAVYTLTLQVTRIG
jgi:hypothetical protein